jgi:hypothetical protein
LPTWLRFRIRIPNVDPDPDPAGPIQCGPSRIRIQNTGRECKYLMCDVVRASLLYVHDRVHRYTGTVYSTNWFPSPAREGMLFLPSLGPRGETHSLGVGMGTNSDEHDSLIHKPANSLSRNDFSSTVPPSILFGYVIFFSSQFPFCYP